MKRWLMSWWMTWRVRRHPDFKRHRDDYLTVAREVDEFREDLLRWYGWVDSFK